LRNRISNSILNGKHVLFIGGGFEAIPGLGQAKALGCNVYVTDQNPKCPGIAWIKRYGSGYGVADTYDAEATLAEAIHYPLDGIVALSADVGPTVSWVAAKMGLSHIPYGKALCGWNKAALKIILLGNGIPAPPEIRGKVHGFVVVKPGYRGRGARGVRFASGNDYEQAMDEARKHCHSGTALVERYVIGPQISAEAVVWEGRCVFTGLTDRDYDLNVTGSKFIELGGWGPSKYQGTEIGDRIKETCQRVVEALEIEAGTIKLDIVLDDENEGQVTVVEAAVGRLSGGFSATHYWPLAYGIHFIGASLAVACNLDPAPFLEPQREPRYCRGVYRNVEGVDCHPQRGRFFLAVGGSRQEAEEKAKLWLRRVN
jgi:hypothetical protein